MTTMKITQTKEMSYNARTFCDLINTGVVDCYMDFIINGQSIILGNTRSLPDRSAVTIKVNSEDFFKRTLADGSLGLGEAYMDQLFEVESGSLVDFLTILVRNGIEKKVHNNPKLFAKLFLMRVQQFLLGKDKNIHVAYDIGNDFYETILDKEMIYSCGYSKVEGTSLYEQQQTKLNRICEKLRLEPGMRLLDIGCGWGGLLIHAAKNYGISGVGVTLSPSQQKFAENRIQKIGLENKIEIQLKDFSKVEGRFDRVVSVGMFEHVMRREYKVYFDTISNVLTENGVALVHAIGCGSRKNTHDPFIQKYIFPLSAQPKLSEITDHLEQRNMAIVDVENIARHYQYTLMGWLGNLKDDFDKLDQKKYDKRFQRMFEFYLCAGAAVSRGSESAVYQVLFNKGFYGLMPLQRV